MCQEVSWLPTLPKLDHLIRLTDSTGIIQHAICSLPDLKTGYTTDDNARALTVALDLWELTEDPRALALAQTYLSFLAYTQRPDGLWHNFIAYDRTPLERKGSPDSFGRVLAALAPVAANQDELRLGRVAAELLTRAKGQIPNLTSPRAMAFTMIGISQLGKEYYQPLRTLADRLATLYLETAGEGWYWFENYVTYCNGVLPEAMLCAYRALGKSLYRQIGLESLNFLSDQLFQSGKLKLVGNQGWWQRGSEPAPFDEQPIDAAHLLTAHLTAYQLTGHTEHRLRAQRCLAWFEGENSLGLSLYDPVSCGCYDGLTEREVNLNQGAESILALLTSQLAIAKLKTKREEAIG